MVFGTIVTAHKLSSQRVLKICTRWLITSQETPNLRQQAPGPEYYLGKNYPLFYDHLSQVPKLLTIERRLLCQ